VIIKESDDVAIQETDQVVIKESDYVVIYDSDDIAFQSDKVGSQYKAPSYEILVGEN
jgi:hypothetical protein